MRELLSSVSEKGQVTIPMEIRRALHIKPRDRVAFRLENGEIKIVPAHSLEASFQAVPPLGRSLTDEEIVEVAVEEHTRHIVKEGL